jgi:hypothetical protein
MTNPIEKHRQAVVHQLRYCANKIESGDGIPAEFDYDEEVDYAEVPEAAGGKVDAQRLVSLELGMMLPD